MDFYTTLMSLCEDSGKKITAVLRDIGLSTANKSKWENGATVNSAVLIKLADYFDCSVDYLLGRTDNPNFEKAVVSFEKKVSKKDLQTVIDQLEALKNRMIE